MNFKCRNFLNEYLASLPKEEVVNYKSFSSDYFCSDEKNANICADLIVNGLKTASCSMYYWYSNMEEPMPIVGHLQVVTDWDGNPVCVIEIESVSFCRFCEVDEKFALEEGEGDRTIAWWREAHWEFFSRECEELGIEPTEDMMLVLERFRVVFKR
ncbi:ASCH domain-containing protein [Vibrio cidicii]|nr:ASCH domain-containing protein [Vibrio cidicii]EJL6400952.1 ASCH domain-containing protein [Vibrio navarrensis]EJL6568327.1 ASCH domain-containing protein [Vibrio navarrensis]MBG0757528.1 RNA-binding protein [Vibrio cidicii]MBG0761799.1 RNA-binding protein [Vibrio cidicii]